MENIEFTNVDICELSDADLDDIVGGAGGIVVPATKC